MIFLKLSTPCAFINQHVFFLKPGTPCALCNRWNLEEEAWFALLSHLQVAQNDEGYHLCDHTHHSDNKAGEQCLPPYLLGNAWEPESPGESLKWTSARKGDGVD